jgi:ABC-type transport system involved in multi-copper enzyme maturation permease subunit
MTTIEMSSPLPRPASSLASTIWWRLVWKEAKQLVPLFSATMLLALVGHGLIAIRNSFIDSNLGQSDQVLHVLPYVLAPILFAVGVGPVLVSQEKEQRTMLWLSSLPLSARWIVGAKLLAGVVGLLFLWALSFLLALPFAPNFMALGAKEGFPWLILLPFQAYFLLAMAFCTAWIGKSAMSALLMLIPVCLVPVFLTLQLQNSWERDIYIGYSLAMFLVTAAIVVPVTWYFGRQVFLAPAPSRKRSYDTIQSIIPQFSRAAPASPIPALSALLWQYCRQNQLILFVFLFAGIPSLILIPLYAENTTANGAAIVPLAAGFLAFLSTLIGASAFGSDQVLQRVRFLAERGVSPGTVWLTRLLVPGCVFTIVFVLFLVAQLVTARAFPLLVNAWVFLALLSIFAATTWWGQICRSRVLTLLGAPVATCLLGVCYWTYVDVLGCPLWLIVASLLISFVATRVMTKKWMDGERTLVYNAQHFSFLALALSIPLIDVTYVFLTYPGMTRSESLKNLEALTKLGPTLPSIAISLDRAPFVVKDDREPPMMGMGFAGDTDEPAAGAAGSLPAESLETPANQRVPGDQGELTKEKPLVLPPVRQVVGEAIEAIERSLAANSGSLRDSRDLEFLLPEVWINEERLRMDPSEENQQRYRKGIAVLNQAALQLRRNESLIEQGVADVFDSTLVRLLTSPLAKKHLEASVYANCVRRLADQTSRTTARRRAILFSWKKNAGPRSFLPSIDADFSGRVLPTSTGSSDSTNQVKSLFLANRQRDLIVQRLLDLVDASDTNSSQKAFENLAKAWQQGVPVRASLGLTRYSVSLWHGQWERQAAELASQTGEE